MVRLVAVAQFLKDNPCCSMLQEVDLLLFEKCGEYESLNIDNSLFQVGNSSDSWHMNTIQFVSSGKSVINSWYCQVKSECEVLFCLHMYVCRLA